MALVLPNQTKMENEIKQEKPAKLWNQTYPNVLEDLKSNVLHTKRFYHQNVKQQSRERLRELLQT